MFKQSDILLNLPLYFADDMETGSNCESPSKKRKLESNPTLSNALASK